MNKKYLVRVFHGKKESFLVAKDEYDTSKAIVNNVKEATKFDTADDAERTIVKTFEKDDTFDVFAKVFKPFFGGNVIPDDVYMTVEKVFVFE